MDNQELLERSQREVDEIRLGCLTGLSREQILHLEASGVSLTTMLDSLHRYNELKGLTSGDRA